MKSHTVRVYPSAEPLARDEQLAWKLAKVATDNVAIDDEVAEMVANRVIDNAAVAIAAIDRPPVAHARAQALAHPRGSGATLYGIDNDQRFDAEWAAWANGTAVRELDMHDTFLAADYSHPGDNIPPIVAVAQQCGCDGAALVRGIVAAYEVQVALVKRHLPAPAQEGPHRAPLPGAGGGDSEQCLACRPRSFTRRSNKPCTSPSPRGNRARGRFQAGKRTLLRTRENSRSRRSTGRCAASSHLRQSTRGKTA